MKPPKTLKPAETTDELFQQIRETIASEDGQFIFRGEDENHDFICSSLARNYIDEIQTEHFNFEGIQEKELEKIKSYTDLEDEDDILAEVRHYGGKVVLIDFTYDYNVALFFACDSEPEKDGRIILINTSKIPADIKVINPKKRLSTRIIVQKSVFLHPLKRNHIYQDDGEDFITVILVPKKLKSEIKIRLDTHHRIRTETIYSDIFGYIQNQGVHQDAETLFYKGLVLGERGDYDGAIAAYGKSIEKNPNIAVTYTNRGNAYYKKSDYDKAIADHDRAIELNSNYAQAYVNRGVTYVEKDDYDKAIADYDKAIEINPNHAEAYTNRGIVYAKKDDYDNAIADFNKAIELNQNLATAYYNRGIAKEILGDRKEAMSDFQKCLDLAKQQGNKEFAEYAKKAMILSQSPD